MFSGDKTDALRSIISASIQTDTPSLSPKNNSSYQITPKSVLTSSICLAYFPSKLRFCKVSRFDRSLKLRFPTLVTLQNNDSFLICAARPSVRIVPIQKPVPKKEEPAFSLVYIKDTNDTGSSGDINSREIPDNFASPFPINRVATKSSTSKIIEENLSPKEAFHQKQFRGKKYRSQHPHIRCESDFKLPQIPLGKANVEMILKNMKNLASYAQQRSGKEPLERKLSLEVIGNTLEDMLEVPLDIPDPKTSEATPVNGGEMPSLNFVENNKFSIKSMQRRKSCHCSWCGGKSHFQDEIEKNPWVVACLSKAKKEPVPIKPQMRSPHARERSNPNRVGGGRLSQRKTIYISANPAQTEKKSIFMTRNSTNRTPTSIFRSSIRLESPLKKEKERDESISQSKESLVPTSEENISEWQGHHERKIMTFLESQRKGSNAGERSEDFSRAKLRPFTMVQSHGVERLKKGPLFNLLLTQVQSLERASLRRVNTQNLEEDSFRNTSFFDLKDLKDLKGSEKIQSVTTDQVENDDERRISQLYNQKATTRGLRLFGARQETTNSINIEEKNSNTNSPRLKPLGKHKITEISLPERSEKRLNTFTKEKSATKLKKILGLSTLGRKEILEEIGKITKSEILEDSKLLKSPVSRETASRRGTDFLKKKNSSILKMYAVDGSKSLLSLRNISTPLEPIKLNEAYKGFLSPVSSCKSDSKRDFEAQKIKLKTKSKRKIIELSQTFAIKKV